MDNSTEKQHALLSASGAHRWLHCTPSARLEHAEGVEECSIYAREGTTAHALAEIKLSHEFGKTSEEEYQQQLLDFTYNDEFKEFMSAELNEYVDMFINFVKEEAAKITNCHAYFETRVNFSNVVPQGFGTADVLLIGEDTIHIMDLKYGKGVPITSHDNPQLRLYAMGALNLFPKTNRIIMSIGQPRLNSYDTEEITKDELLDWAFNYVEPRAELAVKGEGKLEPSEDACRFCKLRGKCKARADMMLERAKQEFDITHAESDSFKDISPEKIVSILQIAPLFIKWFEDIQAYALGQLSAGVKIPGYKLVEGRSIRILTSPDEVIERLKAEGYSEKELTKPREVLGISALEKLVGKKKFAELCGDLIVKPRGKLTMAPISDMRPEVSTLAIAQNDFADTIEK